MRKRIDKAFDRIKRQRDHRASMKRVVKKRAARDRLRRHHIREMVQRMILSGEQKPGAKIKQQEFAAQFGVAQGVVREALLELQAHGLVETIDNRGMFVTELNAERIIESFYVREVHEGLAVRLCCERASRAELKPLVELTHEMYRCAVAGNEERAAELDRDFHFRLLHLSRHSMLIRLAENYRVLGKFVRGGRAPGIIRDEHLDVLAAIAAGSADKAERLVRQHVAAARLAAEKVLADSLAELKWMP